MSNRLDKPKKTSTEIINMLENEKGITFNFMSTSDAANYLSNRNNYLRTASYRKNYDKHVSGADEGKYIHLDFAYLTELSTIDMYLRSILLKMCIDVEHAIKVSILHHIECNDKEDGYTIVEEFLDQYLDITNKIAEKADSIFTDDLISKYFKLCYELIMNKNTLRTHVLATDCPAWVLVEIIGFGDLVKFYNFYGRKYRIKPLKNEIINPIRSLRNACAHNNCILNSLKPRNTQPTSIISQYIADFAEIGKEERKKKLSCRPLFEIVCLLYYYKQEVSTDVRNGQICELYEFVNGRMLKHSEYFNDNQLITTSFNFLKKVVDKLM